MPPRDMKQHLVLWRDNQVTNCRASDFCQWGCLMRSLAEGNPILLGWFFFPAEVKKDKKATERENGNVLYIFGLWKFVCWCFMCLFFFNYLFRNQSQPVGVHGTIFDGLTVKSNNCQWVEQISQTAASGVGITVMAAEVSTLVHISTAFVCGLFPSSLAVCCNELSKILLCEQEAEGFEKGFSKCWSSPSWK